MPTDIEAKKTFLQQSSALYSEMIRLTKSDVIRRYLAFRILVNTMSFEDVIQSRKNPRFRKIRDVLLAHKQEGDFFEGYRATDEITDQSVSPLLAFMSAETQAPITAWLLPELVGGAARQKFHNLVPQIFQLYEDDNLSGFRLINNFLCHTGTDVHEVSKNELASVFYRYNSSKALFELAQYIYNNTYKDSDLVWLTRHAKLDMLLHAQNMADCALKDIRNRHSIDGLLEVMIAETIGDPTPLRALMNDTGYQSAYLGIRKVRNKLIGHMDGNAPLSDLITDLDNLPISNVHDLVSKVDKAIYDAAQSHIAIRTRYNSHNQKLNNSAIVDFAAPKPRPYF